MCSGSWHVVSILSIKRTLSQPYDIIARPCDKAFTIVAPAGQTNYTHTYGSGEKVEQTEFPRNVGWNTLAELCDQLLRKGSQVNVEGRLQTRKFTTQSGEERQTTEIVIHDMLVLDPRKAEAQVEQENINS